MSTLLSAALDASIIVVENGRRKKITKREAIVTQLVNKSASADLKATQIVLAMLRDVEFRQTAPPILQLSPRPISKSSNAFKRGSGARRNEPSISELSPREFEAILRSDLGCFAERCF